MKVSLLIKIVKSTDKYDWGKLNRVLKYLKGTKHMKVTLVVDSLSVVNWWIYALYNTSDDCSCHTGWMTRLFNKAILSSSLKYKLNAKISTEGQIL